MEGEQFRTLMEELSAREIPYQFVPSEKLGSIVRGAHQGIQIISSKRFMSV